MLDSKGQAKKALQQDWKTGKFNLLHKLVLHMPRVIQSCLPKLCYEPNVSFMYGKSSSSKEKPT